MKHQIRPPFSPARRNDRRSHSSFGRKSAFLVWLDGKFNGDNITSEHVSLRRELYLKSVFSHPCSVLHPSQSAPVAGIFCAWRSHRTPFTIYDLRYTWISQRTNISAVVATMFLLVDSFQSPPGFTHSASLFGRAERTPFFMARFTPAVDMYRVSTLPP